MATIDESDEWHRSFLARMSAAPQKTRKREQEEEEEEEATGGRSAAASRLSCLPSYNVHAANRTKSKCKMPNRIQSKPSRQMSRNLILLIVVAPLLSVNLQDASCQSAASESVQSQDAVSRPKTTVEIRTRRQAVEESAASLEEELDWNKQPIFDYHANMPVITKRELTAAIKQATASVDKLYSSVGASLVPSAREEEPATEENSVADWLASSVLHRSVWPETQLQNKTRAALISEEATRLLATKFQLNREQTLRGLPLISVDQTNLGKQCASSSRSFNCLPGKYRSFSGHCNNVQNPDWGSAQTPLVRWAPAHYADQVARPMKSSRGAGTATLLPSARLVSLAVQQGDGEGRAKAQQRAHSHMTTMLSFFGQFVFHDLALVGQFSGFDLRRPQLDCCNRKQSPTAPLRHPECMAIELNEPTTGYCSSYVRSMAATRAGCNLGPRDQMNLVSSYLDASVIYGSSESQMRQLRSFAGGQLKSLRVASSDNTSSSFELLPKLELSPKLSSIGASEEPNSREWPLVHWAHAASECRRIAALRRRRARQIQTAAENNNNQNIYCFQAGDLRVNQNIGLTLMHTIWLREHNYIANKLAKLNKHWNDEHLFEETRRIVIGEIQHITYNEFLPSIIGTQLMQQFNLSIQSQGHTQSYDPQVNAATSNELASTILPFILATLPSKLERYNDRLEITGTTSLMDTFLDASELAKKEKFANYLTGLMSQNAMEPSMSVTPSMDSDSHEVDLVATILQQSRDHGIKPYLYWRRVCRLEPLVQTWDQLELVMPAEAATRLRQVYASVDQLDLYVGILEFPVSGATIGPTFACLLAKQFAHLKHGDRYWYENDLPSLSFSPRQLEAIRGSSLAKVVCRNSQSSVSFIQPQPMLTSDPYLNAYQYCSNRAMSGDHLDLTRWQESVHSAQQIDDELMMSNLMELARGGGGAAEASAARSLARGRRLIESSAELIVDSLDRAKSQLDALAQQEAHKLRSGMAAKVRARRHQTRQSPAANSTDSMAGPKPAAGYRYLPRLKRQTLQLYNQSVIFELATNEVVRSLLWLGKDREHSKSIQSDIRDFLLSLESIQLNNLLGNSAERNRLSEFITGAGSAFFTPEQRRRFAADPKLIDTLAAGPEASQSENLPVRSNSVSLDCQDTDRVFPCDHTSPFRTITGWCNNLNHPKFGASFTPLDRILPNAYEDGLSRPRQFSRSSTTAAAGSLERLRLPSARLISTTMHDDKSNLHPRYSLALMQFGQFGVDHDLTRTPFSVALDGSLLDCSSCDSKSTIHRDCWPIEIPATDAHFQQAAAAANSSSGRATGPKCLHFVRSLNGQTGLGPRQHLNALTAYIDASNVYGSDNCEAKSLRAFVGGRLDSSKYPATAGLDYEPREILPLTRLNPECVTPSGLCFHAGDQRASEQPGLTAMHVIFVRLHNSLVDQLAQLNRHWPDEKLYQHGRRIVGAIMQRITYQEFAPRLLGLDYMSKFDLILKQVGYSSPSDYDDACSASIFTEFAAAAFRMGHSLIRGAFPLLDAKFQPLGRPLQLRTAFFNSHRILQEPKLIDSILRGIVSSPIETLDNSITDELTNHLFEKPKQPHSGMDLVSLNIQRARDHGIAGYNKYRAKCNLTTARNFQDFAKEIPQRLIKRLQSVYAHVDDVDLFTGGMSELPVHGGIIGPTFACIIGMQFARLKHCDRFWHETSDPWTRFSSAQLAEIRKMTLAKVICSQSDTLNTIQRNAMDVPDPYLNPRVPCASLPDMELGAWRENLKSCLVDRSTRIELGQSKRVNPCRSCTCTLEGPICRTMKVDCIKMMRKSGPSLNQIMAEKSCLVQCAWALDVQPFITTTTT